MKSAAIILAVLAFASSAPKRERWVSIPLTTVEQRQQNVAGGEGFQQVMALAYAPSRPDVVYLGSDTAQIWRSTDGGTSWAPRANGFSSNGARSLFVHPADADLVLAAGTLGRGKDRVPQELRPTQGIFRSHNGGASWSMVYPAAFYKQATTGALFAVDPRPRHRSRIYAGTDDGLLVSNDKGRTWTTTPLTGRSVLDLEASPAESGALLVVADGELFLYRDGSMQPRGQQIKGQIHSIAVSPDEPDRVLAAAGKSGLFVSEDGGRSFQRVRAGLPMVGAAYADVAMSPVDARIAYAGTHMSKVKGPFVSSDGGRTWRQPSLRDGRSLSAAGGFYFASPFVPHPRIAGEALTVSNGYARILRTTDGGRTWAFSGSGYSGARVGDIAFSSSGEVIVALTDHGLWRSDDGLLSFQNIAIPRLGGYSASAVSVNDNRIVAAVGTWTEKTVIVSDDDGGSWSVIRNATGVINHISTHRQNDQIIYAGAYRSNNGGKTWKPLDYEIIGQSLQDGDRVYGRRGDTIALSVDRGTGWQALAPLPKGLELSAIAIDVTDDTRIYAATSRGVMIGTRDGWTAPAVKPGIDQHGRYSVRSIAIDPTNPDVVYAGRWAPGKGIANGVFRSSDRGATWEAINHDLGNSHNVWSIIVNPYNGDVYIGSTFGLHRLEKHGK